MSSTSTSISTPTSAPLGLRRGVEKPKPLKCAPPSSFLPVSPQARADIAQVSAVLALYSSVYEALNQGNYEPAVVSSIIQLNMVLKKFGAELEIQAKEHLDKFQVALRNACRDSRLDLVSRLHLLEIIELRAMNWIPNDKVTNYYKQKLAELSYTYTPFPSLNANAPDFYPTGLVVSEQTQFGIKTSPGFRTIGNTEEVSAAGYLLGRDFSSQISEEARIDHDKDLIEQSMINFGSDSPDFDGDRSGKLRLRGKNEVSSPAISATFVGEYKYTVTVGAHRIRIYGSDPNLVRTAKIVLDDYFGEHKLPHEESATNNKPVKSPEVPEPPKAKTQPVEEPQSSVQIKVIRQPLFPASTNEAFSAVEGCPSRQFYNDAKDRRANFAKTSDTYQDDNNNNNKPSGEQFESPKGKLQYDLEFLKKCATSPESQKPPVNWSRIIQEFPFLERKEGEEPELPRAAYRPRNLSYNNNNQYEKKAPVQEAGVKTWDPASQKWVEKGTPTRA